MRIVIDLQGAQSSGSRNRGIGRYSLALAQAMVRNRGEHEVMIALNGLFPDTIESIRAAFDDLLPQDNIRIWQAPAGVSHIDPGNNWRRKSAELLREAFLASLQPDVVHISSLFEGLGDDAVTSIGLFSTNLPTAVTLYDLIPLINRKPYLENPVVESWYENKLDQLRRADLLLAISESSRQEGIDYLGFPGGQVINAGTAADPQFRRIEIGRTTERAVRERYGLFRPFIMYTGGIDYRKNIEGLIRAYAQLPRDLRESHQLAVVCSVQPESRRALEGLANEQGLVADELILTGFVPEPDLIALYHLCKAFIFPSWHEGFGLPALEAMCCGAPVIAANTSSLPEVVGREDALFDPRDDGAIAAKLLKVLTDGAYRTELIQHGLRQARKFSWDRSARLAIAAFEQLHATRSSPQQRYFVPRHRPKLAYVSPLPPARSGIADYSAELLPELARHYEIDVIVAQESVSDPWIKENCAVRGVDWFVEHAQLYGRVLYHFGNSHYHQHMFDLLARVPGTVVLHDFFLSGVTAHMAHQQWMNGIVGTWEAALYHSHGYSALIDFSRSRDVPEAVIRYPCNQSVIEDSQGVIVHSANSQRLAASWLGDNVGKDWSVIPHLRVPTVTEERAEARRALGIEKGSFVVSSFGLLGPTKQNRRLLDSWLASSLGKDSRCLLVFVGENHGGDYGKELAARIRNSGFADRIRITGWADTMQFRQYLAATDIGVQLRTLSRGETSGTVLDCMKHGLPTIVNANGSMADLPVDAVWMLPDQFEDSELGNALETLWKNENKRRAFSQRARAVILEQHAPRSCAEQYAQAIERHHELGRNGRNGLIKAIAQIQDPPAGEEAWLAIARDMGANEKPVARRQLLVEISELLQGESDRAGDEIVRGLLAALLAMSLTDFRVEPVYADRHQPGYRYARRFVLRSLNCADQALTDEPVVAYSSDVFLGLDPCPETLKAQADFHERIRNLGALTYFVQGLRPHAAADDDAESLVEVHASLSAALTHIDGVIFSSRAQADEMAQWLTVFGPKRLRPLRLGCFHVPDALARFRPGEGHVPEEGQPSPLSMTPSVDWVRSAQDLLNMIFCDHWSYRWMPDDVRRFWGGDGRLSTQVGRRSGRDIVTTGQAGYLLYGPYIALESGEYRVLVRGALSGEGATEAHVDVAVNKGHQVLGRSDLRNIGADGCLAAMSVVLDAPCTDLEVRLWVSGNSDLRVSMIEIVPCLPDPEPIGADSVDTAADVNHIEHAASITTLTHAGKLQVVRPEPAATELIAPAPNEISAEEDVQVLEHDLRTGATWLDTDASIHHDTLALAADHGDPTIEAVRRSSDLEPAGLTEAVLADGSTLALSMTALFTPPGAPENGHFARANIAADHRHDPGPPALSPGNQEMVPPTSFPLLGTDGAAQGVSFESRGECLDPALGLDTDARPSLIQLSPWRVSPSEGARAQGEIQDSGWKEKDQVATEEASAPAIERPVALPPIATQPNVTAISRLGQALIERGLPSNLAFQSSSLSDPTTVTSTPPNPKSVRRRGKTQRKKHR